MHPFHIQYDKNGHTQAELDFILCSQTFSNILTASSTSSSERIMDLKSPTVSLLTFEASLTNFEGRITSSCFFTLYVNLIQFLRAYMEHSTTLVFCLSSRNVPNRRRI